VKKSITIAGVLLCALFFSLSVSGQDEDRQPLRTPKWISEKGYWVVESNIHTPLHSTIHFYNNDHMEVYKEEVNGVKINLEKNKTKMKLKRILEQSIVAWDKDHPLKESEQWVTHALRQP